MSVSIISYWLCVLLRRNLTGLLLFFNLDLDFLCYPTVPSAPNIRRNSEGKQLASHKVIGGFFNFVCGIPLYLYVTSITSKSQNLLGILQCDNYHRAAFMIVLFLHLRWSWSVCWWGVMVFSV